MNVGAPTSATSKRETALNLASEGFPVFPVWFIGADGKCACGVEHPEGKNAGKHPITPRGLNDASTDPALIGEWWRIAPEANVGVALPDGFVAIDVDPRNGGEETLKALWEKHGPFAGTRAVFTGGDGMHFYFRVPAGWSLPSTLGEGIDVKQLGGYVLAPPSNHHSGKTYRWASTPTAPIAEAPAWIRALGWARGERSAVTIVDEDDRNAEDATLDAIVAKVEPHFVEGKKHHIAKNLGGWLKQRGYGPGDVGYVIERLPSKNPRERVKAATAAFGIERPFGWSELKALLGDAPAAALDAATPNPRRAGQQTELAGLVEAMAASAVEVNRNWPPPALPIVQGAPPTAIAAANADGSANAPKGKGKHLTTAEVVNILGAGAWAEVIGYDALANRVVCLREPPMRAQDDPGVSCLGEWTDAHTARARTWIFEIYGSEPGKDATDAAVEIVARRRTFHPVQSYLFALRWDGVPRLDTVLARYFGADANDYTRQVGAKTMIAAVARALQPGCKVDTMAILEGTQGIGKSRGVRALAGDQWFADTPLDLESKDAAQCLQGKWIYEIGELHSFNRTETTRIKAFVSSQSDNLRPSYGRRNQDFPRQCVFIGTTNGTEYLTDTTGNRRYWPVKCRTIDVPALQRDRDQLWAEAILRYRAGERWWLEGDEVALAEAQQADREAIDPWEQPLAAWLETSRPAFTMAEALTAALRLSPQEHTQAAATRVGKLLAQQGWRAKKMRDASAKFVRVYVKEAA